MKNKYLIIFTTIILIVSTIIGWNYFSKKETIWISIIEEKINTILITNWKIKLWYCPSMEVYVNDIVNKESFELIRYNSSQQVLEKVKTWQINIWLVWRIAHNYEIDKDTKSIDIENDVKYTYIADEKIIINEKDITNFQNKIKLIKWTEWEDKMNLAVIVDDYWNKILKYRKPTLYYK